MEKTEVSAPPGKQEIIVKRMYSAPRELVYRTLTDPKLIPQWWGPRELTTKVEKMEVRPGGQWRFIQNDSSGNVFPFNGVYHTAKAPELLVYTMEWEGMPDHVLMNIDRFDEKDGQTICTSRSIFETVEDRDGMYEQGARDGAIVITERVNELLEKISSQGMIDDPVHAGGRSISITRIFNAPPEKVWKRWTDPNEYMCWYGPKDYTACYASMDLRPGGKFLNCMKGPDGKETWGTGVYKEIIEPNRIVSTDSFADEHGNIVPATYYGLGSDFPLELEIELTFEDLGGKTRMTLEHCGIPAGEQSELARQGWNESFDKLEHCLE